MNGANAPTIVLIIAAVMGGLGGLAALVTAIRGVGGQRAQAANQMSETEINRRKDEDRRRNSLLDELDESRGRLAQECQECRDEVKAVRTALHRLLVSLEDDIMPMVGDDRTRAAVRVAVGRARAVL